MAIFCRRMWFVKERGIMVSKRRRNQEMKSTKIILSDALAAFSAMYNYVCTVLEYDDKDM